MQMDAGLDTGDILLQRALAIGDDDDAEALAPRLATLGGAALVEALALLEAGAIVPVRQDGERATLAPVLEKEHGRLDFRLPAARLAARIRGFRPWPGAFTSVGGRTLKVHAAVAMEGAGLATASPGRPVARILVGCGEGSSLLLAEVQLEGKRRVPAAEFLKGHPLPEGTVLGP